MRWPEPDRFEAGRGWSLSSLLAALLVLLAACAPTATTPAATAATAPQAAAPDANVLGDLRASFSDQGVIFLQGGRVWLAVPPDFRPREVSLPGPAIDVAWAAGDAWAAVPSAGWVLRVTGRPDVLEAGRVVRLSARAAYREDGTAVTYGGSPAAGLIGTPADVVTGGDGADWALRGNNLLRVGGGVVDTAVRGSFLTRTPSGAAVFLAPTAVTVQGTYRVTDGQLQRVDPTGRVVAGVPHEPALVGEVAGTIVTVGRDQRVRVFRYDLTEVNR